MNGRGRLAKGAAGEREGCALLTEQLGQSVSRRLGQARDGGHDAEIDLRGLRVLVEIKRQERIALKAWLEQAEAACGDDLDALPAVLCRQNRGRWMVVMDAIDWCAMAREAMGDTDDGR